jgi:hypothetical protein
MDEEKYGGFVKQTINGLVAPYLRKNYPHLNHPHLAGVAMVCMKDCIARGEQVIGLREEQFMIVDGSAYQVF